MIIKNIKQGFTLIELLVVITIIGILATGATTVFTSQIQKARDTTRITSMNAIKGAVEQVYQDTSRYPKSTEFLSWASINVSTYMETIPADPKNNKKCNNNGGWTDNICGLLYNVNNDSNGIQFGAYEVSVWFENLWNVTAKAAGDSGWDSLRLEVWILNDELVAGWINTQIATITAAASVTTWTYFPGGTVWDTNAIVINGQ